jgi:long-chain acyl-CoA synthetase
MFFSEILYGHALLNPNKAAICYKDRIITYKELYSQHSCVSKFLLEKGIQQGDLVFVCMDNPISFAFCFFALLNLGVVGIPISAKLRPYEFNRLVSQYNAKLFLTDLSNDGLSFLRDQKIQIIFFSDITISNNDISIERPSPSLVTTTLDMLGIIHQTSGSCGVSKGVERSLGNLLFEAKDIASTLKLTSSDVVLCSSPLYHSFACGFVRATFCVGATLVVTQGFDPSNFLSYCETYKVTVATGVPFLFHGLVNTLPSRNYDIGTIRYALTGGVSIPTKLIDELKKKYNVSLVQEYGLSEGGKVSMNLTGGNQKPQSVGLPIANVSVQIVDENMGNIGTNCIGEIMVKRQAAPKMYFGLPELSSRVFIHDNYILTGDLGMLDEEGFLYITGRKKLMINVAGNKVDPSEIENIILEYPKVSECVVVGVRDEILGELVKAVIVPKPGEVVFEQEIVDICRRSLSTYKVPKIVQVLQQLPRSESGKVLRTELA